MTGGESKNESSFCDMTSKTTKDLKFIGIDFYRVLFFKDKKMNGNQK